MLFWTNSSEVFILDVSRRRRRDVQCALKPALRDSSLSGERYTHVVLLAVLIIAGFQEIQQFRYRELGRTYKRSGSAPIVQLKHIPRTTSETISAITKICTKLHQISGAHIRISARGQIISRQNQLKSAEIGLFLA